MTKVCLLIGEGKSERYFFPKFLERKSFLPLNDKGGAMSILKKDDVYWFFPFPPNLGLLASGKSRLRSPDTYRIANTYIGSNKYFLPETYEYHLIVVSDTDGGDWGTRCSEIKDAIRDSRVPFNEVHVFPIRVEIETWYFAGLDDSFPHFVNPNDAELCRLLNLKSCGLHTKEAFEKHINQDQIVGATALAVAVADNFKEEKAKAHSDSFNEFDDNAKAKGLY